MFNPLKKIRIGFIRPNLFSFVNDGFADGVMRTRAMAVLRRPTASIYRFFVSVLIYKLLFLDYKVLHADILKLVLWKHSEHCMLDKFAVSLLLNNV